MLWLLCLASCQDAKDPTSPKESTRQDPSDTDTPPAEEPVRLLDKVNPFIATGGIGYGVGCAFPGAGRPFGLVKVSPDTSDEFSISAGFYRGGGYHYDDVHIEGFSHMHLHGIGLTDYGILAVMPTDGMSPEKTTRIGYQARFEHSQEDASPGRYEVTLEAAKVQLTATDHTALHHYSFTAAEPTLILDLGHSLGRGVVTTANVETDGEIIEGEIWLTGEMSDNFPIYFSARLDQPAQSWGIWNHDSYQPASHQATASNEDVSLGLWMHFDRTEVSLRVALSNVDLEGARNNLQAEHDGFDFESAAEQAKEDWASWLDDVEIWGGTAEQQEIFATSLYHTLLMPTLFSDVDGRYRGFDGQIQQADRPFYTDFSLWDTYRTTHPWYTLVWPRTHEDFLWSLSRMAVEGNGLARWPLANSDTGVMLGTSLNIVFPEAYQKGLRNFAEDTLYTLAVDAMLQRQELDFGAPPNLQTYEELGYYPADFGRSVAWTQEQSIADYALSRMAQEKGDTEDAEQLLARASNWKNVFDPAVGFFHARERSGEFTEFDSEILWLDEYAEGNARQYLWLAPHDPEGLFDLLGGQAASLARLHEMFEEMEDEEDDLIGVPENWYWHGNEPGLHIPWLFALAGEPEATRQWSHWLLQNRYSTAAAGIAGNDDGGTLSAWYLFASMGIYPLAGTTRYVIGEPIFDKIRIPEAGIEIRKQGTGELSTIMVNDTIWTDYELSHSQLQELVFVYE